MRALVSIQRLLLASLLAALAIINGGCLTIGERDFTPVRDDGRATVYVYRKDGLLGHNLDLEIKVNGDRFATLETGRYHVQHLAPGELSFGANAIRHEWPVLSGVTVDQLQGNTLLTMPVEAGEVYFVIVEEGVGSILLEPVSAAVATHDLRTLRSVEEL